MEVAKEFREFAIRGNVMDMAVGIVIGVAFGNIVSSLVADIIMPPVGLLIGGVDFADLAITLQEAENGIAAVTVNYGIFLKTVIDFLIIALVIFFVVRGINAMKRKQEAAPTPPPAPSTEEKLLAEIRDLLKQK